MALVTSPFSWTYYVRVFPRGVGTAQTRICYDEKLFMPLVTRPFSFTMFEYSPVVWGFFKLVFVTIISSSWLKWQVHSLGLILFEYSPVGWGLLKLDAIMIVCSDIELSYILSFRCDPGRGLLQQTITILKQTPNATLWTMCNI